jgi:eukaryotic-like serine/threonine-protein kinase
VTIAGGSRLGPYRIVESIGAGGMGEVYRAVDTRLDRPVAVKVLPPHLSAASGMRERFEREARTISALSHPNICSLFDIGREGDVDYLVMELLEGHTLAERIARGPLPIDELLRHGLEIINALDKAHRQKIIHRDLKPGNVFLTRSGAKLLDFGLAKFAKPATTAPNAPTEVLHKDQPLTAAGSLVGTVPYMSPEQLEGKEVDERSDLFSFGAILYEMATGRRPFGGNSQASLIASILEHEPQPVSELRPSVPQSLDRLIRACLEKDPENRVQSAHDVKLQLQWISLSSGTENRPVPATHRWTDVVRWLPWLLAAAALAGLSITSWRAKRPVEAPVEFALRAPGQEGVFGIFPAVSPDGSTIVAPARDEHGDYALWLRHVDSMKWRKLEGTEHGNDQMKPFFSPNGKSIGYFANRHLRVLDLDGGVPRDICPLTYGVGGAWLDDGTIVFSPSFGQPMHRVSAVAGSKASVVPGFEPIAKEAKQGWPVALPKGRFLFLQQTRLGEPAVIFGASVSGGKPQQIIEANSLTGYSAPWLLFVRKGTLFAQRFDAEKMAVQGDAVPIADHVAHSSVWMHSGSAVSARTLLYPPAVTRERTIRWLDRSGQPLASVLEGRDISLGFLAPDDSRILYFKEDMIAGSTTLWTYDLKRAIESKLTTIDTLSAAWSPDGNLIAHDAGSGGATGIQVQPSDGSRGARSVGTTGGTNEFVASWVSEREILVDRYGPEASFSLWRLPIDGSPPAPLVATEFNEYGGRLSPDQGWLAFESNRSGRGEIFVRSLSSGETIQISSRGGGAPEWSRHEIFFIDDARDLQAVPYTLTPTSFEPGEPRRLFAFPEESAYDVTQNGQKILLSPGVGQAGQRESLHVLVGWKSRLPSR